MDTITDLSPPTSSSAALAATAVRSRSAAGANEVHLELAKQSGLMTVLMLS